jgi:hypothetical protein
MHRLLCFALSLSVMACLADSTDALDDRGVGGKADDHASASMVTIAQAGAFSRHRQPVAQHVHYGFLPAGQMGPGWTPAGSVKVQYDADGNSLPVRVAAGGAPSGTFLGFAIKSIDQYRSNLPGFGYEVWSQDQFLPLGAPHGRLVRVPVSNGAGYPFEPECYQVSAEGAVYDGRIAHVFYGLTGASASDYASNNDVPWHDLFGQPRAAGVFYPTVRHDGGYKGSMRMMPQYVWVPEGKHLVFKLAIDRFWGQCGVSGDTSFREHTETKTYFVEVGH